MINIVSEKMDLKQIFQLYPVISFEKLKSLSNLEDNEIRDQIRSLKDSKTIKTKAIYICPECSSTLGSKNELGVNGTYTCPYCDTEVALISTNAHIFFFRHL